MTHETNIEIIKSQCYKKNGGINGRCNEIAWWQKRNLLDLHTDITFYTNFLSADSAMNIRLFHYINKLPMGMTESGTVETLYGS